MTDYCSIELSGCIGRLKYRSLSPRCRIYATCTLPFAIGLSYFFSEEDLVFQDARARAPATEAKRYHDLAD